MKGSSDGSAAAHPNMHIWHMPSGKLAGSYQQKVFKNDSIQWSGDGIPSYIKLLSEMSFNNLWYKHLYNYHCYYYYYHYYYYHYYYHHYYYHCYYYYYYHHYHYYNCHYHYSYI